MNLKKLSLLIVFISTIIPIYAQDNDRNIEQSRKNKYYLIEAKNALSHSDLQKAIALYNQCISEDENCATGHYELANIAIAVKDIDVALTHSRKAVQISPNNKWYLLQLAEILENKGILSEAAKMYEKLSSLDTDNPFYLQKSMMLYEATAGAWDEALNIYDVWEKQYGLDFNLMARKQALYSKAGKSKEGINELKRLIKENPKNSEYLSLIAMYYIEQNDEENAAKTFDKIENLESISGVAQMMLTRYYMGKEKYSKAFDALKESIRSGEVDENANIAAVLALLQTDTTDLVNVYRDTLSTILIEKYPENAIGYLFKAQQYGQNKDYDSSKEVLNKALELDPTNYNGLAQMSVIYNIEGKWDKLYEISQQGIMYYPQEHLFYLFKGLAASQKEEYLIAETSLTTSFIYAKDDLIKEDIQELLADVYYKSGKKQKAFDLFEQLLEKNPDNVMVLNNYAYFLALENESLGRAEEMSRKTLIGEENNPTYLDTYAWVLYQQGKYQDAYSVMEKAINNLEEGDASSEMWEHYGDILNKIGEKDQAIEEWKKALELPDPNIKRLNEKLNN